MIEQINQTSFKASKGNTTWELLFNGDEWEVYSNNPMTRAHQMVAPKFFKTLNDVEKKYKAFAGISKLV